MVTGRVLNLSRYGVGLRGDLVHPLRGTVIGTGGFVMTVLSIMAGRLCGGLILTPVAAVPQRAGLQAPGTLISAELMSGAPGGRRGMAHLLRLAQRQRRAPEEGTGVVVAPARRGAPGRRAPRHRLGTWHLG